MASASSAEPASASSVEPPGRGDGGDGDEVRLLQDRFPSNVTDHCHRKAAVNRTHFRRFATSTPATEHPESRIAGECVCFSTALRGT